MVAATKSGNGHQKTCKLSSDPDFLLFKFSCKISLLSLPETSIDNKNFLFTDFFYIKTIDLPATNPTTNRQPSRQQTLLLRRSTPVEVPADDILLHSVLQIHLRCWVVRCRKCPVPSPFVCHNRRTSGDWKKASNRSRPCS